MISGLDGGLEEGSENSLQDSLQDSSAAPQPNPLCVFYDGTSSRRRQVRLAFKDQLEISEDEAALARWPFADIRRADSAAGILRVRCVSGPSLARLEIRDAALAAVLISRCSRLDDGVAGRQGVGPIIGWSVAAAISIAAVVWLGLPLAADRLAPLVPEALERRIGDAAERQIRVIFGGKTCSDASGRAAFNKLMTEISQAAGIDRPVQAAVLNTPVPNAFALPGGKVYLFSGLLAKAENSDEIAGVLAHELGHVRHRDNTRNMIYSGGTSFLIGLLFGDITGSGALVFASRSLVTASYSREAEQGADDFSVDVMHRLGRPTKPMGELIFRITGNQADNTLSILSNHPLTEDRLKHLSDEDRPASGPPLLSAVEWTALKAICKSGS
jgi:Zn-dependent protease with chaperone function